MIKVDFTGKFKSLDGELIKAANGESLADIHVFLANSLTSLQTDDPMRNLIIAKKIYESGIVELEKHDIDFLKKQIKKINISDIMKSEVLIRVENVKNK